MRAWNVLRQLLAATLCAVLALPACSSAAPLSSTTPSHSYDAATLSKTRVWGSNEKILLHFRAVEQLSEKQRWGCAKCSSRIVVGTVVTYDYDAFGNLIHSTGTTPNNYLFAGEQFDPDLALYYNRARYLNTNAGRFWTMDTFEGNDESPSSLHKYLYVTADPSVELIQQDIKTRFPKLRQSRFPLRQTRRR
jgi:RHS repeat-associated protein